MTPWRTLAVIAVLLGAQTATAQVASDQAAAILVYPVIQFASVDGLDTLIQISNTSEQPVRARCFYVNANGHCSNSGAPCFSGGECPGGQCLPSWQETDFYVRLTGRQPMAWLASQGLLQFCSPNQTSGELCIALDGTSRRGPNGQSNVGTRVPPVGDDPFVGELKCVVVDEQNRPSDRNVLVGSATSEQVLEGFIDVTRFNAIGIAAIPGANDGDNRLVLGEEYEGCSGTLILDHYFDGGINPATGEFVWGALALVPCSQDFLLQDQNLASVVAQFLVFNEFEQRFSTSTRVQCYASLPLSNIDTMQETRSLFHVGVAGTLSGQTRIRGVGSDGRGLLGAYFDLHGNHSSAVNLHLQGMSEQADVIRLP